MKYTEISNINTFKFIYLLKNQHLLKGVPLTTMKIVHGGPKNGGGGRFKSSRRNVNLPCIFSSAAVSRVSRSEVISSKSEKGVKYVKLYSDNIKVSTIQWKSIYHRYQLLQQKSWSRDWQLFLQVFPPELPVQLQSCSHHPLRSLPKPSLGNPEPELCPADL